MMRIGQVLLREVAAMVELANDTAVKPRCDQQRARVAQRLASALARCGHLGRPGGVIASAHGCRNQATAAGRIRWPSPPAAAPRSG
jgi:hypothetical protein